jgi:AmmeMemoRadiSam system protein B
MLTDLRPSPIAGQWYEGQPERLAQAVDTYIERARLPDLPGQVIAVIAPHAGHVYSGPVAGFAFAALKGLQPELVAVVSPMHHNSLHPLITTAHAAYATPLGKIMVDKEAVAALDQILQQNLGFGLSPVARDAEHSLEIELPFLQRVLSTPFTLLPVMVRRQSPEVSRQLGLALAQVLRGRSAVLVASTDLSHFYNQETANRLDAAMLEQVAAFSPEGAFEIEARGQGEACGLGAMTAVMWAARELGADSAKVLKHATSGDVTGDFHSVVGYGAGVFYKS